MGDTVRLPSMVPATPGEGRTMPRNVPLEGGFAKRLRTLRRRAGMTACALGERAGVTARTICELESGRRRRAQERTLLDLAAALGVGFDELVTGRKTETVGAGPSRRGAAGVAGRSGEPAGAAVSSPPRSVAPGPGVGTAVVVAAMLLALLGMLAARDRRAREVAGGDAVAAAMSASPPPSVHGGASPSDLLLPVGPGGLPLSTDVPCAREAFVDGVRRLHRLERAAARRAFERAIACDSSFALAWAMLGHAYTGLLPGEQVRVLAHARELARSATPWESTYVAVLDALVRNRPHGEAVAGLEALLARYPAFAEGYRLLGHIYVGLPRGPDDLVRGVAAFETAVRLDPDDGMSLNRLAYAYADLGRFDRALETVARYRALCPDEPNPWDTTGDLLAGCGRWAQAEAFYREALRRDPAFGPSLLSLGELSAVRRDDAGARRWFRRVIAVGGVTLRRDARVAMALVHVLRGRLAAAEHALRQCIATAPMDGGDEVRYRITLLKLAGVMAQRARVDEAFALVDSLVRAVGGCAVGMDASYHLLALRDPSRAESLAVRCYARERPVLVSRVRGGVALRRGRWRAACDTLCAVSGTLGPIHWLYEDGLAAMRAGRLDRARENFERLVQSGRSWGESPVDFVRAFRLLGEVYERLGRPADALRMYGEFVAYWQDADEELQPEVEAARARMRALATQPALAGSVEDERREAALGAAGVASPARR